MAVVVSGGTTPSSIIPGITASAISDVWRRYVLEELDLDDPRVDRELRKVEEALLAPRKRRHRWLTTEGTRETSVVEAEYQAKWNGISLDEELRRPDYAWFEWNGRGIRARVLGRKHVYQLFLVRALEWLRPSSVAEVGFGWGANLLTLSVQFPAIRFGGVELTEAGVRTARRLAADPRTDVLLRDFVVTSVRDRTAPARLALALGSADALPFPDRSFDTVVTVLALEQMERIRPLVLREIARVAQRHVVMIEPFREWNSDGHRPDYIKHHDYWSGAIADLQSCGLRPIAATADMPQKLTFRAGIVVAEVTHG
jgi:hypothetical protein